MEKTNAMRILEKNKISYQVQTYEVTDGAIDGVSVAKKIGQNPAMVYKTLVTQGKSKDFFVFVIPVEKELNLKLAAKAVGEKSVEMIPVADINKVTGYIRGGCSPVGMKKLFKTTIDSSAKNLDCFFISGGKIGIQIGVPPIKLAEAIKASFEDIVF